MTREIQDLRFVKVLRERPSCIPKGRPRGAKAAGVRYEEALAASSAFAEASHGVWLEFGDARGHGFAQVDFVFATDEAIVVAEAKVVLPAAGEVHHAPCWRHRGVSESDAGYSAA